ncbi:Cobyrinic acid ac-diamide synthase, partial [gut metagenome]
KKPLAVIINRAGQPESADTEKALKAFCETEHLPILAALPFDRQAAEAYARGEHPMAVSPRWKERFKNAAERLTALTATGGSHD